MSSARDPVYAALALEPRIVCPFEVAGVRMNLAQLRHTLANCAGWAGRECRVTMTDERVWLEASVPVTWPPPGVEVWGNAYATFARAIRADGVSVIDPRPLS